MKRSRLLSVLTYGLVILGLAGLRGELLALAIPFMLYLGLGQFLRPEVVRLKAQHTLSAERVTRDTPATVKVTITNQGPPIENLLLESLIPRGLQVIEGEPRTITTLQTGDAVEMAYTLSGQRGHYRLPALRATASSYLGLFSKQVLLELPGHLLVLPHVHRLPNVAIRPRRTLVYPGLIPARKGGPGVEFFGVRDYQPGDSLRWINHRASARYDQALFVNEFEQERAVDVGLILDVRETVNVCSGGNSLLEYSVEAAATLTNALLNRGNRVGLFIYGGLIDWTFPGYGKIQRERILYALTRAELQRHQVFDNLRYLPKRLFPIRSQLLLVSPLRPADLEDLISLRARGYQLLIVCPDPVDFEKKILGASPHVSLAARIARLERGHLFHQLGRAGIRVFEWQVDVPFHLVAQSALGRVPLWSRGPRGQV